MDEIWSSVRFRKAAQAEVRGDVDEQYSGPKAGLHPIFDKVASIIQGFGPDVAQYTRRNYVVFSRRNHFASVSPVTRSAVGIAFKMKDRPFTGRLEPNKDVGGGSFSHLVVVKSSEEVDAEVVELLRAAYDAQG